MRRFTIILIVIALFVNCAQKVGVGLQENFKPEIEIKTGRDFPELKAQEIINEIRIEDKTFALKTRQEKAILKLPRKYMKLLKEGKGKPVPEKNWQIAFNPAEKALFVLPVTDTIKIECEKQDPENFNKFINFAVEDFDSLEVLFRGEILPRTRLNYTAGDTAGGSILKLQIPVWESIDKKDYQIQISRPFYEDYSREITKLDQNRLKLGLSQSELQIQLINKESSPFIPRQLYIENAAGQRETYLATEIEGGVSLYDLEFPVKVYGSQYRWQFFNYQDEKIENAVYTKPGEYKLYFLEKERELPIILYDISRDQINKEIFENWVLNKMEKIDNVFLYLTNGYENIFNNNDQDYNDILNRIYRMQPRTSNILESIERFSTTLKRKNILDNYLNSPAKYGNKLQPHYYIFLSGDNVERLSTAINHFLNKINKLDIPKNRLTVCIEKQFRNNEFAKSIEASRINLKVL